MDSFRYQVITPIIISFGIFGKSFMSTKDVATPSSVPNCESIPNVNNMRKNRTAHNCAPGNWLMASVKIMKARPVPEALWKKSWMFQIKVEKIYYYSILHCRAPFANRKLVGRFCWPQSL